MAENRRITVWADTGCPWATLAIFRLHKARREHDAEGRLDFDIRAFPLELFNSQPTPRLTLDAEIPVVGGLEPDMGMRLWNGPLDTYPVTMLPALEAVAAAKSQGLGLADRLDLALRMAFFRDSKCISMQHEICEIASEVEGLDATALEEALRDGSARASVFADAKEADEGEVQGSPHVFLPDGSGIHHPGITMHKTDGFGRGGYPIVDKDEPWLFDDIVERSLA